MKSEKSGHPGSLSPSCLLQSIHPFHHIGHWILGIVLVCGYSSVSQLLGQNINTIPIAFRDVVSSHQSPYVVEFTVSLTDIIGTSVVVDPGNLRLVPREDGRLVSEEESGAIVLPGENKKLHAMMVLDYSRSMTSLRANSDDNSNGVSDSQELMERHASELLSALTKDTQAGIVEFHNELTSPAQVEDLTSDPQTLLESVERLSSDLAQQFSGSTRVWDAVMLSIQTLIDAVEPAQRNVFFYSDGTDESSLIDPVTVAQEAIANGVRLHSILYNRGQPVVSRTGAVEWVLDFLDNHPAPYLLIDSQERYLSGEAALQVPREALTTIPADASYRFLGPPGVPVYLLQPGQTPALPVPSLRLSPASVTALNGTDISIRMVDFSGPGDCSIYTVDASGLAHPLINTIDGLNASDQFSFNASQPWQPHYAFSQPGSYILNFRLSGTMNGSPVTTQFKLEFLIPEDFSFILSGTSEATFTFDGTSWNQILNVGGSAVDTQDTKITIGPENQIVITNPADFPFYSGSSVFLMPPVDSATALGLNFAGVAADVLVDNQFLIQLVDFNGPGSMYTYSDPSSPFFNTENGLDASDAYLASAGESFVPFWAFSEPGDYTITIQASGTLVDPEEETMSSTLILHIQVSSDPGVMLVTQTGGQQFYSRNFTSVSDLFTSMIYNLQGQYILRWSTLKRGPTPFIPSFQIFLNGASAQFEGSEVTPSDIDGSVLDAQMLWDPRSPSTDFSRLTLQMDFVPRDFSGFTLHYASRHPFQLSRILPESGGLLPANWNIEQSESNGVGMIRVYGPRSPFGLQSLPFTSAGRLFQLRFDPSIDLTSAFYEFSVAPENPSNSISFPNQSDFISPLTALLFNTPIPWLSEYGFVGDIPTLAIAERTDHDGDGDPTWLEYRRGTNPVDPSSRYHPPSIQAQNGGYSITIPSASLRTYTLEATSDFEFWEVIADHLPGNGKDLIFNDLSTDLIPARFYRTITRVPQQITIEAQSLTMPDSGAWLGIHSHLDHMVAVGTNGRIAVRDASGIWHFPEVESTTTLWDVIWFNNAWIAVGNDGIILRSEDAHHWSIVDAPSVPFLWNLAANSSHIVAVGYQGGILTSSDGLHWTESRTGTREFLREVIWDGARFVSVGGLGIALTSPDGQRWMPISIPTSENLFDIVFSLNRYVLVGSRGTILTGPNLNQLSSIPSPLPSHDFYSITYSNGLFLIGSNQSALLVSQFGNHWSIANPNASSPDSAIWDFSNHPNSILAVGSNNHIWNLLPILH
ncbi:MAG: choice-of-anchor M domain-containing protein [Verrucomicrobia bacterium]|nr:choice-of-anchor M domain-containing protein [Verrucomicrobiota bacterium]